MRFFGWFGLLTLFWILVELSFFELLFPHVHAPLVLIALVLSVLIMLDQHLAFWWAIGATLCFDIFRSGDVTLLSLYFALVVYVIHFLSQRLLFAREHTNRLVSGMLAVGVTIFYEIIFPVFSLPQWSDVLLVIPVWFVVSWSVEKLNAWLVATSFSEFRGMRHS